MAEYIDRQALGIGKCNPEIFDDKGYANGWNNAIDIIQSAPAADVRPVVLCRDCIHARHYTNKIKCGYWSEQTASEIVCEDDFCSYGERREEASNDYNSRMEDVECCANKANHQR